MVSSDWVRRVIAGAQLLCGLTAEGIAAQNGGPILTT